MISASNNAVLLYASDRHTCPYLPGRDATTAFVDPHLDMTSELYGLLLDQGFRRSGNQVYRPYCKTCTLCLPVRLSVSDFRPNRSQRRTLKMHAQTTVRAKMAEFEQVHLDLYNKYMASRHTDSDMGDATRQSYMSFLSSTWCDTRFYEIHHRGRLIAVTVADVLPAGLSAVYTFFDPDYAAMSPGQFAILWLLQETRRCSRQWLYLGYWIPGCNKMEYKAGYRPLHVLIDRKWRTFLARDSITY